MTRAASVPVAGDERDGTSPRRTSAPGCTSSRGEGSGGGVVSAPSSSTDDDDEDEDDDDAGGAATPITKFRSSAILATRRRIDDDPEDVTSSAAVTSSSRGDALFVRGSVINATLTARRKVPSTQRVESKKG